jgi:hypothetical protein
MEIRTIGIDLGKTVFHMDSTSIGGTDKHPKGTEKQPSAPSPAPSEPGKKRSGKRSSGATRCEHLRLNLALYLSAWPSQTTVTESICTSRIAAAGSASSLRQT